VIEKRNHVDTGIHINIVLRMISVQVLRSSAQTKLSLGCVGTKFLSLYTNWSVTIKTSPPCQLRFSAWESVGRGSKCVLECVRPLLTLTHIRGYTMPVNTILSADCNLTTIARPTAFASACIRCGTISPVHTWRIARRNATIIRSPAFRTRTLVVLYAHSTVVTSSKHKIKTLSTVLVFEPSSHSILSVRIVRHNRFPRVVRISSHNLETAVDVPKIVDLGSHLSWICEMPRHTGVWITSLVRYNRIGKITASARSSKGYETLSFVPIRRRIGNPPAISSPSFVRVVSESSDSIVLRSCTSVRNNVPKIQLLLIK